MAYGIDMKLKYPRLVFAVNVIKSTRGTNNRWQTFIRRMNAKLLDSRKETNICWQIHS